MVTEASDVLTSLMPPGNVRRARFYGTPIARVLSLTHNTTELQQMQSNARFEPV